MGRAVDDLVRMARSVLTPERLPESPPGPDFTKSRKSVLRLLLGPEPLPESPPAPPRARASAFRLLFGREPLPLDPVTPRPRRRWLTLLLAPERLDPPEPGPEVR